MDLIHFLIERQTVDESKMTDTMYFCRTVRLILSQDKVSVNWSRMVWSSRNQWPFTRDFAQERTTKLVARVDTWVTVNAKVPPMLVCPPKWILVSPLMVNCIGQFRLFGSAVCESCVACWRNIVPLRRSTVTCKRLVWRCALLGTVFFVQISRTVFEMQG